MIQLSLPTQTAPGTICVPPLAVAAPGAGVAALATVSFGDLLDTQSSVAMAKSALPSPLTDSQSADFTNIYAAISVTANELPVPVTVAPAELPTERANQPATTDARPASGKEALPGGKVLPQPAAEAKIRENVQAGKLDDQHFGERPEGSSPPPPASLLIAPPVIGDVQTQPQVFAPLTASDEITVSAASTSLAHTVAATNTKTENPGGIPARIFRPDADRAPAATIPPLPAEKLPASQTSIQKGVQIPAGTHLPRITPPDGMSVESLPLDGTAMGDGMSQTAPTPQASAHQAKLTAPTLQAPPAPKDESTPSIVVPMRRLAQEPADAAAASAISVLTARPATPEHPLPINPTVDPIRLEASRTAPVLPASIPPASVLEASEQIAPSATVPPTVSPTHQAVPVENPPPHPTSVVVQSGTTIAPSPMRATDTTSAAPLEATTKTNYANASAEPSLQHIMTESGDETPAPVLRATSHQTAIVPAKLPEMGADLTVSADATARTITTLIDKHVTTARPVTTLAVTTKSAARGGQLSQAVPAAPPPLHGALPNDTQTAAALQASRPAPLDVGGIVETIARARADAQPTDASAAPAPVLRTTSSQAAPIPALSPERGADLAASVGGAARNMKASVDKPIAADRPAATLVLAAQPAVTGGELPPAASAPVPGALPTSAPTPTAPQGATASSAPMDVARIVETIARAREEAQPAAVEVSVRHAEFGPVSLRFEQDKGDLTVALRNADPDFVRAVSAATASDPSQARGDTRQDPSRQEQSRHEMGAGPQTGTGQGQTGQSRPGQDRTGRDHRTDPFNPQSAQRRTSSQGPSGKAGDNRANGIFA